jgi:uncharacterized protein with LGFP repeats
MADKMTPQQLAGYADATAAMLLDTAKAMYPGNERKAAMAALLAACMLPDLTAEQVCEAIRARYRAARNPAPTPLPFTLEDGETVTPAGVVIGQLGHHGSDSHQAARDYAAIEAGEL